LVLHIWGIDEQALQTLDDIQLYKVQISGAEPEFVTLGSFLRCLFFIFITYSVIRGLPSLLNITIFPNWSADVGIKYALQTISKYITFLIGFFFVIAELHLDLAQLGWLMAAIGVGLGFGLQEIVSNFVSGLILLAERPVKPGDIVTIGNLTGTVSRINIRATTIVNFDRQEVMVPNRNLITTEVINWTRSDTVNRVVIPIGVAYGSDVDFVSSLLLSIAKGQKEVLTDPEPTVIFMLHGESSLDLELRVFVSSPDNIMPIRDKLNREISKAFAREKIEIPFPQRDLHIKVSGHPGQGEIASIF
jgi:potassium efflux system protein